MLITCTVTSSSSFVSALPLEIGNVGGLLVSSGDVIVMDGVGERAVPFTALGSEEASRLA